MSIDATVLAEHLKAAIEGTTYDGVAYPDPNPLDELAAMAEGMSGYFGARGLEIESFTPTLRVGGSDLTSGYDDRWGYYVRLAEEWVIVVAYADHPSVSASSDFVAMSSLPHHDDTVTPPDRAAGVWWHCSLLDGVNSDQNTVWLRMRCDIGNSYAYVNDSQGNLGRTSWSWSGTQEVRLGLLAMYRVSV